MYKFLWGLGARKRGTNFILDGFNSEFYLRFDTEKDIETPESAGTVDVYIVPVGPLIPIGIRLLKNCSKEKVLQLMALLNI